MVSSEAWRGRRVLITGGGGFIGGCLSRRLAELGSEVHAVGRTKPRHLADCARVWPGDIAQHETTERLIRTIEPQVVFHLASSVTGRREIDRVRPTFDNNLATTVNVLIAATEARCERIILTGSMEEPEDRDADPLPPSPYAAAKWASSVYGRMFHALYGSPVVRLRVFMVYGPGQTDADKLIPYVTRCFLEGEQPRLSSGLRPVDWVYVDDVVDAYVTAAEQPGAVGAALDIGSGEHVTIREVVERVARITGTTAEPMFGALADRPLERAPLADVETAYRVLGWRPKTDLETGLARTVAWFREQRS